MFFPVRQYLLFHKYVIYTIFTCIYMYWSCEGFVLLIVLQWEIFDEEPSVCYLIVLPLVLNALHASQILSFKDILVEASLMAKEKAESMH